MVIHKISPEKDALKRDELDCVITHGRFMLEDSGLLVKKGVGDGDRVMVSVMWSVKVVVTVITGMLSWRSWIPGISGSWRPAR
jgi:hypothetical protein